ncbi:Zinc finger CCCH-type [Penicillium malachiteum]|uniref:Zinc finger CCCH-type n=1 Tax=Penicillium malachiteum TaxID=1324776 RepID=A0AAD6HQX3_9EURO|nr:Zinc finger CCCH-type [Penicillium malachiteum]
MAPTPVNMDAAHFCARPNGDITSMICVDDLPDGTTIDGAPRKLSPAETQGMTSCGMMPNRSEPWIINQDNKSPVQNGRNGFAQLKSFLYELMEDDAVPSGHRDTIGKLMCEIPDEPIPSNALIKISPTLTTSSQSSFQRRARGYGRKEYCSYWIRHGECDYQQQGCLFKHEMPLDQELLETLGLRDIPRWYRDKHGLRSLLSTPDYPHPSRTTRLSIADRPRTKSIAYPENCTDSTIDKSVASNALSQTHGNSGQSFQAPIRSTKSIGGTKKGRGNGANGQQKGNGGRANGNNQNKQSGETIAGGSSVILLPESAASGTSTGKSGSRGRNRAWRKKANGGSSEVSTSPAVNGNVDSGAVVKKTSPLANEVTLEDPNEQTTSQIVISLTPPSTKPSPVSSLAISYSSPMMPAPDTGPNIKATADSSKTEDSAAAKANVDAVTVTKDDSNTEENVIPTVALPGVIPTGPKAARIPAGPKADRLPPTATPFSPARSVRGRSFPSPSRQNEGSPTAVSSFSSARNHPHKATPSAASRRSRRAGNASTSSVATIRASQQPTFTQYVAPMQHPNPVDHASSARHLTTAQQMILPQQAQQVNHPTFGHHGGQHVPGSTPDFQLVPHPWHPNVRRMQGAGGPIDVVDNFPSFGGVRPLPFDYSDPRCPTIEITEASPVQDAGQGFPAQGLPAQGPAQGLPAHGPAQGFPAHGPAHGLSGQAPFGHGFSHEGFAGQGFAGQGFAGQGPVGHVPAGHGFVGQGFPSQGQAQGITNWPMLPPGLPVPDGHPVITAGGRALNPSTPSFAPLRRKQPRNIPLARREAYADDEYHSLDSDGHFRGLHGLWDNPGTYQAYPANQGNLGNDGVFSLDLETHWLAGDVRGILRGIAPDDKSGRASAQQWASDTFGEVTSKNVNRMLEPEDPNPIPPPWDRGSEAFVPRHDGPFHNDGL